MYNGQDRKATVREFLRDVVAHKVGFGMATDDAVQHVALTYWNIDFDAMEEAIRPTPSTGHWCCEDPYHIHGSQFEHEEYDRPEDWDDEGFADTNPMDTDALAAEYEVGKLLQAAEYMAVYEDDPEAEMELAKDYVSIFDLDEPTGSPV